MVHWSAYLGWNKLRRKRFVLLATCLLVLVAFALFDLDPFEGSFLYEKARVSRGAAEPVGPGGAAVLVKDVPSSRGVTLPHQHPEVTSPLPLRPSTKTPTMTEDVISEVASPKSTISKEMTSDFSESISEQLIARYRVDMNYRLTPGQSPWQVASDWVNKEEILPDEAPELGAILRAMNTAKIIAAEDRARRWHGGHMPKIFIQLDGGQWAIFKPKWYERDFGYTGKYLCGVKDIHTSEIAAFHISRILGLRKTPLIVGRRLTLKKDILPVARESLLATVYKKPETNETCIYGNCTFCQKENEFYTLCLHEEASLEGAVILFLPEALKLHEHYEAHPWLFLCKGNDLNRTMTFTKTWPDYCNNLLSDPIDPLFPEVGISNMFYNNTVRFMQLMDSGIFHYLVMNYDRKTYVVDEEPYKDLMVMLDNGKSFAHPDRDDHLIMAPVWHCCRVRRSTYERLLLLQNGTLGRVVRAVLAADPISPVLAEPQYAALDRRLSHVLHEIQRCIDTRGSHYVFQYD